jgi:hypothetical protein
MKCAHKHKVGDKIHLLARPNQAEEGNVIRGCVADLLFQRDQFKVILDNGLYFYFQDAPKIGQNVVITATLDCLE